MILRTFAAICTLSVIQANVALAQSDTVQNDREIHQLLASIETTLGSNSTVTLFDVGHDLLKANSLVTNASTYGRELLSTFPDSLRKRGSEAENKGDAVKAINYKVFADYAATIINDPPPQSATPQTAPVQASQVVPIKPPSPPALSKEQQALLDRGDQMLSIGNVVAARMLYQRAADTGVGVAAVKLGDTYDQEFLENHKLRGIVPDAEVAAKWYHKAQELGEPRARQRLQVLQQQHKLAAHLTE